NGAGKTTLVRSVIGLIQPTSGSVRVAGGSPARAEVRRRLGVVQQDVGFPSTLTVREIVEGAAARAGAGKDRAKAAMTEMGLADLARRRASNLSGGQQQRLQLAMGLVADPALLVLDEPTVGLDAASRKAFWATLEERRNRGTGILLTTHIVEEAAALADRIVVLHKGRVVAEGTPSELQRTLPGRRLTARTSAPAEVLRAADGGGSVTARDGAGGARGHALPVAAPPAGPSSDGADVGAGRGAAGGGRRGERHRRRRGGGHRRHDRRAGRSHDARAGPDDERPGGGHGPAGRGVDRSDERDEGDGGMRAMWLEIRDELVGILREPTALFFSVLMPEIGIAHV